MLLTLCSCEFETTYFESFSHAELSEMIGQLPFVKSVEFTHFPSTVDGALELEKVFKIDVTLNLDITFDSTNKSLLEQMGNQVLDTIYNFPDVLRQFDSAQLAFSDDKFLKTTLAFDPYDFSKELEVYVKLHGSMVPTGPAGPDRIENFFPGTDGNEISVGADRGYDFGDSKNILGQIDTEFVFCYELFMPLHDQVDLKYRITHPLIIDPDGNESTGYERTESVTRFNGSMSDLHCWFFTLEYVWEIAEGTWKIELLFDDRLIHSAPFEVVTDPS